jgi:hypothetical protein
MLSFILLEGHKLINSDASKSAGLKYITKFIGAEDMMQIVFDNEHQKIGKM